MEVSPIILLKMLFVAFLFGFQAGVVFDLAKSIRSYIFCAPKSKKIKGLYNLKAPILKQSFYMLGQKRIRRACGVAFEVCLDAFFVIYSSYGLVKINFSYNDGDFRFFTVLAFFIGFLLYYFTVSKIILLLLELIMFGVKYINVTVFAFFRKPFSIIYNYFVKNIKKIFEKFSIRIEKKSKKVYNICETVCDNENVGEKSIKVKVKACKKTVKSKGDAKNEGE